MNKKIFILTTALLLINSVASGEHIKLKSGNIVIGDIVHKTDKYIKVDVGIRNPTIYITYYFDEIESVAESKRTFRERRRRPKNTRLKIQRRYSPKRMFERIPIVKDLLKVYRTRDSSLKAGNIKEAVIYTAKENRQKIEQELSSASIKERKEMINTMRELAFSDYNVYSYRVDKDKALLSLRGKLQNPKEGKGEVVIVEVTFVKEGKAWKVSTEKLREEQPKASDKQKNKKQQSKQENK